MTNEVTPSYRHTPMMGEISGFGGRYESACQDMLEAGMKWLEENCSARPEGHSYENIYGILVPDNEDAKALEKVVLAACPGGATGAMHHAVMARLFFIAKNGWQKYVDEVSAQTATEADPEMRRTA